MLRVNSVRHYYFRKADLNAIYAAIDEMNWNPVLKVVIPEDAILLLYYTLYSIIDIRVPPRRVTANNRYVYPDWYTTEIIRDIRSKAY